ncbi:hypothetical protein PROFUN_05431 [Planoprotostelium fungivorum]|uniref:Uncharacterized protein n=1 Tax=Planoprotostelium fungivorum TaxID=1890364 RepID=A0A2P6NQS0_9EUKA|nr:hypothetical protein PROFUN_05431 [Planoprotostelium fungivorum]
MATNLEDNPRNLRPKNLRFDPEQLLVLWNGQMNGLYKSSEWYQFCMWTPGVSHMLSTHKSHCLVIVRREDVL